MIGARNEAFARAFEAHALKVDGAFEAGDFRDMVAVVKKAAEKAGERKTRLGGAPASGQRPLEA